MRENTTNVRIKPNEQGGWGLKTCQNSGYMEDAAASGMNSRQFLAFFLAGSLEDSAVAGSDLGSDFGFVLAVLEAPPCPQKERL